ncbi:MAG: hypothetical protein ABSD75_24860 [Terriglobales bacterium]
MGLCEVRLEKDGFVIAVERSFKLLEISQSVAPVVMGVRVARIKPESLLDQPDRNLVLALLIRN